MRQILMSLHETEMPEDLRDGERVEVIRLGGPSDGDRIGYATVELMADGSVTLHIEPDEARDASQ